METDRQTDTKKRANCWSITINNPTQNDEDCIATARQNGWSVEGQKEKGAEGTEHYQLMLKTPQVRFSAVKKIFPRAHIEVARNPVALKSYVKKEETRIGDISQNTFYTPSKLVDEFASWLIEKNDKTKGLFFIDNVRPHLVLFDEFIGELIEQGQYVELLAVNPQIRSVVKNYSWNIIQRVQNKVSSQTDRQTDAVQKLKIQIPSPSINALGEEEDDEESIQTPNQADISPTD